MNNEWFEIAWINFAKAILHGQLVTDDGREVGVEQVLTDAQREQVYALNEQHESCMKKLLRSFAVEVSA